MMNRRMFVCGLTLVTLPAELAEGQTADSPTSTRRTPPGSARRGTRHSA
jgi:hypothetical protein